MALCRCKIYVGDVGTEIVLDCKTSLSTATMTKIKCRKPDGTEVVWIATVVETTKVKYIAQPNDFDQAGVYAVQAYVELPGWRGLGETVTFEVFDPYA